MSLTVEEIEDDINNEQFDRLLAAKRHKELIALLKQLIPILSEKNDNSAVKDMLTQNREAVNVFLDKVKEISKPEISVGQTSKAISEISGIIKNSLKEINNNLAIKEWEFKINRDYNNRIISVTASKHK